MGSWIIDARGAVVDTNQYFRKKIMDTDSMEERDKYHAECKAITRIIEKQPTVDAVEVVRCKDCKHRRNDEDFVSGHYCALRPSNGGRFCEDEDFCSYGERRMDV